MFTYIVDLYHRSISNQKLTAHERAVLKAIQGAIIGFFASFIPQLIQVMLGHAQFNLTAQGVNTLLVALALGLFKLWAAQTDSHLGDVLDAYSKQLIQQGIGEVITASDGTTQIPAVHIVIPTIRATAAQSAVQLVAAPSGSGVVAGMTANGVGQSKQFASSPGTPLKDRAEEDTQPNLVVSTAASPILPLTPPA